MPSCSCSDTRHTAYGNNLTRLDSLFLVDVVLTSADVTLRTGGTPTNWCPMVRIEDQYVSSVRYASVCR